MKVLQYIFLILLFYSCAKSTTEKVSESIDRALSSLSKGDCEAALTVLNEVGDQNDNPIYLQVLASAYACKANFVTATFISDDIPDINVTTPQAIFKSLSILTLSDETEADSIAFSSIQTGLDKILSSTSGTPGQLARDTKFGTRQSSGMGVQALILGFVNIGKFLNYYGNVDSSGVKGAGSLGNSCFLNYNDPRAQLLTGASTGACTSDNDGHADLDQSTADGKRRLCEGLILLTNIIDILENIDLSNSSTLSALAGVTGQVQTFKTAANAAGLGTLITMTSQSACITYLNTPAQLLDMEYFYALIFDSGLQ